MNDTIDSGLQVKITNLIIRTFQLLNNVERVIYE